MSSRRAEPTWRVLSPLCTPLTVSRLRRSGRTKRALMRCPSTDGALCTPQICVKSRLILAHRLSSRNDVSCCFAAPGCANGSGPPRSRFPLHVRHKTRHAAAHSVVLHRVFRAGTLFASTRLCIRHRAWRCCHVRSNKPKLFVHGRLPIRGADHCCQPISGRCCQTFRRHFTNRLDLRWVRRLRTERRTINFAIV